MTDKVSAALAALLEFIKENFDKLLLTFLFLIIFSATVHMAYHNMDASDVAWARESAGTILGGLLGLITGYRMATAAAAAKDKEPK